MSGLSKDQKSYRNLHICLFSLVFLYLVYHFLNMHCGAPDLHCLLREWFGIYCPFCGGTRALCELLCFRLLSALRYNAYVVLLAFLFLVWDIVTLIRFLCGKKTFFTIPKWVFVLLTVLLVLFFIFRTVLYFGYGVDWIGDFTTENEALGISESLVF